MTTCLPFYEPLFNCRVQASKKGKRTFVCSEMMVVERRAAFCKREISLNFMSHRCQIITFYCLLCSLTVSLATVRGPIECKRRSDELPDKAVLDVTCKSAPFSSSGDRRVTNPNTDRRLMEIAHLLKTALEATLLLENYPRCLISVSVTVLADDGSRLSSMINAASLASLDAGLCMRDILCACSAGYAGESTLVDLNRREESSFGGQPAVYLPCAMLPQRGTIVLSQCEARVPDFDTLERVQEAAMDGCRAVFDTLQAAIRERASTLLIARNGQGAVDNALQNSPM